MARLKVLSFSVKASANQRAKWAFWAAVNRCRSVGKWLERVADREVERRERERGVYDPPSGSRLS